MSDDLEKRLSALRPEGDPKFQQQLEDRLLAQLAQRNQRKMNANGHLKHMLLPPEVIDLRRTRPINLTLVATITIFLLIGVAIAALMQSQGNEPQGAAQQPTVPPERTATPLPSMPPTLIPFDYTVQAGDDCISILAKHGHQSPEQLNEFYALNGMRGCELLVGMTVRVPQPLYTITPAGTYDPASIDPGIIVNPGQNNMIVTVVPSFVPSLIPGAMATATPVPFQPSLVPLEGILPTVPPEGFPSTPTPAPNLNALSTLEPGEREQAQFFFGGIALLDYQLMVEGNLLVVDQAWQTFDQPYYQFIHVQDQAGNVVVAQEFLNTAFIPMYPGWKHSESIIVSVESLEPGEYTVITGLYYPPDGARLPLTTAHGNATEAGDFATLGTIHINVCASDQEPVVTALRNIPHGTTITAEMVTLTCWEAAAVPDRTYSQLEQVIGTTSYTDLRRWSPILTNSATDENRLEEGEVAISIPLDPDSFYALQAGDHLDIGIVVSVLDTETRERCIEMLDEATCTEILGAEDEAVTPVYFPIAQAARVLLVGMAADTPLPPEPETGVIVVAVDPQTANVLSWAVEAEAEILLTLVNVEMP